MHLHLVVIATTKVRIFKQITTCETTNTTFCLLLLLPQRYVFSSKSQPVDSDPVINSVVIATTKVRIFKQITMGIHALLYALSCCCYHKDMIPGADK